MVSALIALACGRGHRVTEPAEARVGIVFDDLRDARHLESVFQVPSKEWRGEQHLIATETTHEHSSWTLHNILIFGISTHESPRSGQIDVLQDGLHLCETRAHFYRCANFALDHTEQSTGTHIGQDLM